MQMNGVVGYDNSFPFYRFKFIFE